MTEHELQNAIRLTLGKHGIVLRLNVGSFQTADGRYITSGLPPGTSDLIYVGHDRVSFIEVKTPTGRISPAQKNFINAVNLLGGDHLNAGVARSVADAEKISLGQKKGY